MPKEIAVGEKSEGQRQFPETLMLEIGVPVIAIPTEVRQVDTKYGERTVVEAVVRGKPETETFSIWWPRKLPTPPMLSPFLLVQQSKKEYRLTLPEGDAESKALWAEGKLGDEVVSAKTNESKVPLRFRSL